MERREERVATNRTPPPPTFTDKATKKIQLIRALEKEREAPSGVEQMQRAKEAMELHPPPPPKAVRGEECKNLQSSSSSHLGKEEEEEAAE